MTTTMTQPQFTIVRDPNSPFWRTDYMILDESTADFLRDRYGNIRIFGTRSSARKRISRELRGDFHR